MFRVVLVFALILGCARVPGRPGGLHLVDDAGTVVTLTAPANRIVSLVPAATELLFALGAGPAVVGRTQWCDYPAAAALVPSVGDGMDPNVEAVVARDPDLVVAYRSAGNAMAISRLRDLGVPVIEVALDRFDDFERDARLLAQAIGRPAAGDSLALAVRADLEAATTVAAGPRRQILILAWSDPPIAIGRGSFQSEILERAGGTNVFGDMAAPSFAVSLEAVVERNPDAILVMGEDDPMVGRRPEWQAVGAIKRRRYVRVSGSKFSRPSPRIGDAVRELARALSTLP